MPCLLTARHRIKKQTISVHRQCRRQAQSSHAGEYTVSRCDCFLHALCAHGLTLTFDAYRILRKGWVSKKASGSASIFVCAAAAFCSIFLFFLLPLLSYFTLLHALDEYSV